MRILSFILMVVMVASGVPGSAAEKEGKYAEMKRFLPRVVGDYQAEKKDERYSRDTAFRYMNGAAELYRAYSFRGLLVQRFRKPGQPALLVEMFDMGTPADAFGIFSYETGDEELDVGQGSEYGGGLLRFWKGRYFIQVYAERETPTIREDILRLGRAIAGRIEQEGPKPLLIRYLPTEGLAERSVRYFHNHQILNHHYFLSHSNILRLGPRTKAVLGTYRVEADRGKTLLLVVQYPGLKEAKRAFIHFTRAYLPESDHGKAIRTESGRWTAAALSERYVLVVFDAPSSEKAEELIVMTRQKIGVTGG